MSKLSLLIHLNAYSDAGASNAPSLSNFKWTRDMTGILASNPISEAFSLAPGESRTIFSGARALSADRTTQYDITLKALSSNIYRIKNSSGMVPGFRTARSNGADATTQVTSVVNGPIVTFSSTGGTPFNFSSAVVGDYVRIGSQFNVLNQGEYKVLAKTTTSITLENHTAANEVVTLGSDFINQFVVYSASGVQRDDVVIISTGFSSATFGSYKITDVTDSYIEFYSADVLPLEVNVRSNLTIYSQAKNLVYLESDQKAQITINGSQVVNMEPFIINASRQPGVFMLKATVWSFLITNSSTNSAQCFVATIE